MAVTVCQSPKRTWQEYFFTFGPYGMAFILLVVLFPFLSAYAKSLMTQILIYGVFAISLNLLIGYLGMFSLGHAAFFGIGGYTSAILITKYDIDSFWLSATAGVLAAVLMAAILGVIVLRAKGIYFLLITLAFGELLAGIALRWNELTHGSNGVIGIGYPQLGLPIPNNDTSFYYLVLVIAVICIFFIYRLVQSPFGRVLQGIREDEDLMQHLGYNTWLYKYISYIIAGLFAGVAGVLWGYFNNIFLPAYVSVTTSVMGVLMVIIGGSTIIYGPIIGAAIISFIQYYASVITPARWPLVLGLTFVLAVTFLRGGIAVYFVKLWRKLRKSYGSAKD